MKKVKSMEAVAIFFLKKFNLYQPKRSGKGRRRCAAGQIADLFFYGGFRREHDSDRAAITHHLLLLVPEWFESPRDAGEMEALEAVRGDETHPHWLYGKFIHSVLNHWDNLVKKSRKAA